MFIYCSQYNITQNFPCVLNQINTTIVSGSVVDWGGGDISSEGH